MKLINTVDSTELDVKKYPMPTKGTAGAAKINGEDVTTMFTSGRGNEYTYFRIKNVDMYVSGKLDPAVEYTLELPEGFGSETAPAARKSYYIRKRPAKNADGSVPVGGSADAAEGAPHTEVVDGQEVAVNPDGTLAGEPTPEVDPAGNPLEGVESTATEGAEPSEAPKARKRR